MIINVDKLRKVGIKVVAKNGSAKGPSLDGVTLEIYFENGRFPQQLHDAIQELMPGQKIEADIVAEGTFRKISEMQLVRAFNENE